MGMGKKGFCYPGAKCLVSRSSLPLLILFAFSTVVQIVGSQVHTPQCRIQKCTTDFVSLTSHLNAALDGFDTEFCKALRAYSACTQRTAKSCRGNLVFHSAVLGISDLMSQRNCSKDGPTSPTHPEMPIEPCNYHSRHQQQLFQQQQASWLGVGGAGAGSGATVRPPTYLFCGLFGDPHLRTFKDHFQTCKVEGAWPLIDNNYLSVQVTNVPVVLGSSATATNKITIIFKPYQDCTDQKVYQAVTDDLPAAFVDGTISGGEGEPKSLWVIEKSPGHHVEIHAAYIGVTVIVRQLGRYLTLAARVPEEMAMAYDETQDLQLCVNGCPSAERIDRDGHLPLPLQQQAGMRHQHHNHHHHHHNNHNQPHHLAPQQQYQQQTQFHHSHHHQLPRPSAQRAIYSLEAAMARCSEQLEVEDIYFHSCVFDLLTTGDANFTMAAHDALRDMKALHPRKEHWHIFPSSGTSATHQQGPPLAAFALFCLLITSLLC